MKKSITILIILIILLISLTCILPGGAPGYDEKRSSESAEKPVDLTTPLPSEMLASPMPTLTAPPIAAVVLSSGEDARQLMLFSHQRWHSLWTDCVINDYAGDGSTIPLQSTRVQVWIAQPTQVRMLSGPEGSAPDTMWVSDGKNFSENNSPAQPMADYSGSSFYPPTTFSDTIYPHPLDGMFGTPLSAMIFPTGLAQRAGFYNIVGEEMVVGRRAVIIEWGREKEVVVDRFWIDAQTGIILRWLNFSKPGGQAVSSEMYVTAILVDPILPEQAFSLSNPMPRGFANGSTDVP